MPEDNEKPEGDPNIILSLIVLICIMCTIFSGEPDLVDALIYWMMK